MKKFNIFIIALSLFSVLGLSSCVKEMDKYYESKEGEAMNEMTLMEYLRETSEFSDFVKLIDEAGLSSVFEDESRMLTLFAPVNGTFPDMSGMSKEDKEKAVLNHVAKATVYSKSFSDISSVVNLAGKALKLVVKSGEYRVNNIELLKTDLLFTNGILHKTSEFVPAYMNLQQWLDSLGDDYSIFKDSIEVAFQRTFDKENSEIIGIDDDGAVIYDSVWVVKNPYIKSKDLSDETICFTLMAPSDHIIDSLLRANKEWLADCGKEMDYDDTCAVMTWIMNAAMHPDRVVFEPETVLESSNGSEMYCDSYAWRDSVELSNGRAYTFKTYRVPPRAFMKTETFNPYWIRYEWTTIKKNEYTDAESDYDKRNGNINTTDSALNKTDNAVFWQFSQAAEGLYYQFQARSWDNEMFTTEQIHFYKGSYTLRATLIPFVPSGRSAFDTDALDIYLVDGEGNATFYKTITGIKAGQFYTNGDNGRNGIIDEDFQYTGSYEDPLILRFVVPGKPNDGVYRRICIGQCSMIPNDNF